MCWGEGEAVRGEFAHLLVPWVSVLAFSVAFPLWPCSGSRWAVFEVLFCLAGACSWQVCVHSACFPPLPIRPSRQKCLYVQKYLNNISENGIHKKLGT